MNTYIFLTEEGYTYQPNSNNAEPDIENLQVIGFGQGNAARDALSDLIEQNEYLFNTSFDEIFAIQLKNNHREYFSLKELPLVSNNLV